MSLDDRRSTRSTEWLGVHEAAMLIGVSPATLRRWSDAGDVVTFTTPGGHRRFSRSSIVGLLPVTRAAEPSMRQLDGLGRSLVAAVRREGRAIVLEPTWKKGLTEADQAVVAEHALRLIDGVVAGLDPVGVDRDERIRAARRSATACGAIVARRAIDLRTMIDAALRLRTVVVHDLAAAARALDLDGAAAAGWLETATCTLDDLTAAAMRGHAQVGERPDNGQHESGVPETVREP